MRLAPNTGTIVHVSFQEGEAVATRRGIVVFEREGNVIAEFTEAVPCQAGKSVSLHFAVNNARWEAAAVVAAAMNRGVVSALRLTIRDDPTQAERRRCVRLCTAAMGLTATINERPRCAVLNVSAEGMAVITPDEHMRGAAVSVAISYDDIEATGVAQVAHALPRHDGRWRCGLFVPDSQRDLLRGLQRLTASVQRGQLHRMARA